MVRDRFYLVFVLRHALAERSIKVCQTDVGALLLIQYGRL
jgi:hypothetical protein